MAGVPLPDDLAWLADPTSPEMRLLERCASWVESEPGDTLDDDEIAEVRRVIALVGSVIDHDAIPDGGFKRALRVARDMLIRELGESQ